VIFTTGERRGQEASAMAPAINNQSLEPHESADLDDQGYPGKSARDKNSYAVYLFLEVLARVVRLSHPDGGFGLIGNAAIPHHNVVQEHRSAIFKRIGSGFRAQGQHVLFSGWFEVNVLTRGRNVNP
jgi:hypothetical protein